MPDTSLTTLPPVTIDDIVRTLRQHHPDCDGTLTRLAYDYAEAAHQGILRKSGEPYIVHPMHAALTVAQWGLDQSTVVAALLHDVPEDTDRSLDDVRAEFGDEVAFLVEGVTKLGLVKYRGVDRYIENLRRMFVAMAQDVRVIVIKFADRIHNLKTLDALPPEKQRRIAMESIEIYAAIANRLGMGEIKGQIEDLAFPYVYPEAYAWLIKDVVPWLEQKAKFLHNFERYIEKLLAEHSIHYHSIHGRTKHLYSLFQKMERSDHDLSRIYDLAALRIVVDSVAKCYETLGVIHEVCKPLKGRIKDYIAQPKPNGYQSLHTTVFAPTEMAPSEDYNEIIEIQIRTPEMHQMAEYGIASHWAYKEHDTAVRQQLSEKTKWMQQLVSLQQEVTDEEQFLETLKIDVFSNHIFVLTPHGDVIELPEGATPVDFAYKIHSSLGDHCNGAKVNDSLAKLDTILKSGDMVEIIRNPHRKGPSVDWLQFVKTNAARHHIRAWVHQKEQSIGHIEP